MFGPTFYSQKNKNLKKARAKSTIPPLKIDFVMHQPTNPNNGTSYNMSSCVSTIKKKKVLREDIRNNFSVETIFIFIFFKLFLFL
jgi:hypothetical protein